MHERHADPLDEANAVVAAMTENAIAAARMAVAPETHPDFDGETCVRCGDDIPEQRLRMGKIRCVKCQSLIEQQVARQRGGSAVGWDEGA